MCFATIAVWSHKIQYATKINLVMSNVSIMYYFGNVVFLFSKKIKKMFLKCFFFF